MWKFSSQLSKLIAYYCCILCFSVIFSILEYNSFIRVPIITKNIFFYLFILFLFSLFLQLLSLFDFLISFLFKFFFKFINNFDCIFFNIKKILKLILVQRGNVKGLKRYFVILMIIRGTKQSEKVGVLVKEEIVFAKEAVVNFQLIKK